MKTQKKVVVTGMGTVNPLGSNLTQFWENCRKGKSGIRKITDFEVPENYSQIAGIVDDFDFWNRIPDIDFEDVDRNCLFALAATKEALDGAGFDSQNLPPTTRKRFGVFLSTAIAQIAKMEQEFLRQSAGGYQPIEAARPIQQGKRKRDIFHFNTVSKTIANYFGLQGGTATIPTGCTGGLDAISYAMDAICCGDVDVAITGSTEAPITPLVVAAFGKIGATSLRNAEPQKASRPFDRNRDGFVLAEGCGILVLESLEHAIARGANILAEVAGYGSLNNCYHMTDIPEDGERIAKSAIIAMEDAGVSAQEIDFINAHGSSTPQNDVAEANAFWQLFGERAQTIPVTSIKSQLGHPLSAANSIEVISSVLSLNTGIIPPTINLKEQDPRCRLDVVGNEARLAPVRCVLKTSSGFSGIHSSLIIRNYQGGAA
jgi:3-oxoacyl-(acyl-carrier-protein) synthase